MEAVERAINGEDPTNGSDVFYNPTTTKKRNPNNWVFKQPKTIKINKHQFARSR
jgi:spore germination cell wall hydrolase CwlJ-like protein